MQMDIEAALSVLDAATRNRDNTQMAAYSASLQVIIDKINELEKSIKDINDSDK